ncbi:Fic family protein [Pseudonocardia phyllosphaerae]|uniref:Fic family protein n=1 Tax=Pseudonocardia phyllosphaerae TaxID=3390502 RepID=UPI00397B63CB
MDLQAFTEDSPGALVAISGTDAHHGQWRHAAFVPDPLSSESPALTGATYRIVANARAALAALDSTSRQLPNPRLFRRPSLQAEAQSTSALEGTYAPLAEVLTADTERPPNVDLREIFNYVEAADAAFDRTTAGHPLTVGFLGELQAVLVTGTSNEHPSSGRVRGHRVVVGQRADAEPAELPVRAARFIPPPPGIDLHANLQELLDWMSRGVANEKIDPVVAAAMAHYQFESLHPFHDGNGRIGRLLIVVHLLQQRVLFEPTLTVSPWFEARRTEYYDSLLRVSTEADWDSYVGFFARGLEESAKRTRARMLALVDVQTDMKEAVRRSPLRADTAHALVDFAVANISFTVRAVEGGLGVTYGRANTLVNQLVQLGLLAPLDDARGPARRFYAPQVYDVLLAEET